MENLKNRIIELARDIQEAQGKDNDPDLEASIRNSEDEAFLESLLSFKQTVAESLGVRGETDTYVVYHKIHVKTPHEYHPKIYITDVPEDEDLGWNLVDEYRRFSEFGSLHANHGIQELTSASDERLKRGWRDGEIERVSYAELLRLSNTVDA